MDKKKKGKPPHFGDLDLGRKDEEAVRAFYRRIPLEFREGDAYGSKYLKERLGKDRVKIRREKERVVGRKKEWLKADERGIGRCLERFEWCRETLRDSGLIGTIQGGGVYRVCRQDNQKKEIDYYKPIMRELELYWAEQPGREYHLRQRFLRVLDTAHGGARPDGKWARPDLTLLGGKVLPYLPGKFLDVITFEVKPWMPLDGLYEALAHRRRANFAYVVCVCPEHEGPPDPVEQATLVAEATRQGIGVILVRQEDDFGLWSELVEPVRHDPDPQHLHDFLETQCDSEGCLEELREWLDREAFDLRPVDKDKDVGRLPLTTKEREVARKMVEMIYGDGNNVDVETHYPLAEFIALGSDKTVRHVREVLAKANFISLKRGRGNNSKAVMSLK